MRGVAWFAGFAGAVLAANWAIASFGVVPVGFGLAAPAGVYFAGAAFVLRDGLQESWGKGWTVAAILLGAALSLLVSPGFALASGAAFLASELLDLAVYTPLRRRGLLGAMLASNAAGLLADSALFLWLAFGSAELLAGQIVGKVWATAAFVPLVWLAHRRRTPSATPGPAGGAGA